MHKINIDVNNSFENKSRYFFKGNANSLSRINALAIAVIRDITIETIIVTRAS